MSQMNNRSIRYYLSERFRLRFEDMGLDVMLDDDDDGDGEEKEGVESGATKRQYQSSSPRISKASVQNSNNNGHPVKNDTQSSINLENTTSTANKKGGFDITIHSREVSSSNSNDNNDGNNLDQQNPDMNTCRTLDGELATDEYAQDAQNYRILLAKIDGLLDKLMLDA